MLASVTTMNRARAILSVVTLLAVVAGSSLFLSSPAVAEPESSDSAESVADDAENAIAGETCQLVEEAAMLGYTEPRCCPTCVETNCTIVSNGCCSNHNFLFVCHQYNQVGQCIVGSCDGNICP